MQRIHNPGISDAWGICKTLSNILRWWGILRPWHIQNSLLRHFQTYTFSNINPFLGKMRDIKAYWGIFRNYWRILSHIHILITLYNPCIYNRAIFRTLTHLDLKAFSKACQRCKMTRHIQSPQKQSSRGAL